MTNKLRATLIITASLFFMTGIVIGPTSDHTPSIAIPTDCPDDDYTIEDGYAYCDG